MAEGRLVWEGNHRKELPDTGFYSIFGVEAEGDGSHRWTSSTENKHPALSF